MTFISKSLALQTLLSLMAGSQSWPWNCWGLCSRHFSHYFSKKWLVWLVPLFDRCHARGSNLGPTNMVDAGPAGSWVDHQGAHPGYLGHRPKGPCLVGCMVGCISLISPLPVMSLTYWLSCLLILIFLLHRFSNLLKSLLSLNHMFTIDHSSFGFSYGVATNMKLGFDYMHFGYYWLMGLVTFSASIHIHSDQHLGAKNVPSIITMHHGC